MHSSLFLFLTILAFPCISSQGLDGPIFHITGSTFIDYFFNINGTVYADPNLTLIKGQTYQFSIDYINDQSHPFGFTSTDTGSVEALGAIGNEWCKTSINNAFITTDVSKPCVVNYTANNDAFYRCSFHPPMIGKLTVITPTTSAPTSDPTSTPTPTPTPDPSSSDNSTTSPPTNTTSSTNGTTVPPTTQPPTTQPTFNGTIFHIIGNNGSRSYIFNISGVAVENPSFDLVLGETYQFSIDYINDPAATINRKPHPFGFTTKAGPAVESLGGIGNENCKTTIPNAFITTDISKPCIITYVANINTFYQCSIHPLMRGALNIIGSTVPSSNSSSSSSSSSTGVASSTAISSTGTSNGLDGPIFHIVGSIGVLSYTFNINGQSVENPTLTLKLGQTYQFSIDYNNDPATGSPHPFGFSTNGSTAASIDALGATGNTNCKIDENAFMTTNVSKPCIITYIPKVNAFYRCSFHGKMIGTLNVINTAPSSTGGPTPTHNPNCVAGVCINTASSLSTSIYLSIITSFIALAIAAIGF